MPDAPVPVILRMIASPAACTAVLSRLSALCAEQGMTFAVIQEEAYWKIPDRKEVTLHLYACPTWNYGQWSKVYHTLFEQDFTLAWEEDESICLYTYPPSDAGAPWMQLFIPSACFWPKPSKDIRHGFFAGNERMKKE